MKAVISFFCLILCVGCVGIKEVLIIKAIDAGTPYLEDNLRECVTETVKRELAKTSFPVIIQKYKQSAPLVVTTLDNGLTSLEEFFRTKKEAAYLLWELKITPILAKYSKKLSDFDVNKDREYAFNEFVRLYFYLQEKDLTWLPEAQHYLMWRYLLRTFVAPSCVGLRSYYQD